MDLEARSIADDEAKAPLLMKLREYKGELGKLKREVREAIALAATLDAREDLLNASERGGAQLGNAQNHGDFSARGQAMETTERLARTGERIKESRRALLETEDLGVSILQDLQGQRETIERSRETLHGADDAIGRSRKILSNMGRRARANKMVFYGVSGMLALALVLVLYYKLR